MRDQDSKDDDLNALLARGRADPARRPSAASRSGKASDGTRAAAEESVADALKQAAQSGGRIGSSRLGSTSPAPDGESLQSLLRERSARDRPAVPARERTARGTPASATGDQELEGLLHGGGATRRPVATAAEASEAPSVEVARELAGASERHGIAPPDATRTISAAYWRAAIVAGLVGLVGATVFYWPRKLPGPDETLRQLGDAVRRHQAAFGELPAELRFFPEFPKDALEWRREHWDARNAAGKVEIVWFPDRSGRFAIVLRDKGEQGWVLTDDGKIDRFTMH